MAGSNRLNRPRRGSLQFWPRKRARRELPRIRNWVKIDSSKLLGFLGYKVGMTQVSLKDNRKDSITKGQEISWPITVIECPPLKIASARFYKKTHDGFKVSNQQDFDDVRLIVKTQPKLTSTGKKQQDFLEIGLGGKKEDKLNMVRDLLGKDIKINEVFKEGQLVDVHGVTKGKGFQGTVKRFGVPIRSHKSEKTKRGIGTLGPWRPRHVLWTVAQSGKMGYHLRTEYNKAILKISNDPNWINPKSGFVHYGLVKNDYILLHGSIPGPSKRAIILTEAARNYSNYKLTPEITFVSKERR